MRYILLHSFLLALFGNTIAVANPIPYNPPTVTVRLYLEKVDIKIVGDVAKVSGTYNFSHDGGDHVHFLYLPVCLPVYAAKGTRVEEMTPKFKMDGDEIWEPMDKLDLEQESDSKAISSFGEMPQLEGQDLQWFQIHMAPRPRRLGDRILIEIQYTQKLAWDKFIYTPLIPHQKEGKDYGTISVSADRPLALLDSDKHDFVQEDGKFVVKPSHKRAIVVAAGKVAGKLP